ncbi:hypothetical protein T01_13024 [Trichinella spiralis]|uniref:Secreted protein n=1 Tax=Trichinella spiralis TaxID=6334 RepID=A0A0V1AYE6_TRISP|nr:hypothetical protein T01_13024 [Trichinella spiralis]
MEFKPSNFFSFLVLRFSSVLNILVVNGRKGGKAELTPTTSLLHTATAEYGNYVTCSEFVCSWVIVVPDRSSCDLLRRLLIPRCNKGSKRLSGVCFVTQSS